MKILFERVDFQTTPTHGDDGGGGEGYQLWMFLEATKEWALLSWIPLNKYDEYVKEFKEEGNIVLTKG